MEIPELVARYLLEDSPIEPARLLFDCAASCMLNMHGVGPDRTTSPSITASSRKTYTRCLAKVFNHTTAPMVLETYGKLLNNDYDWLNTSFADKIIRDIAVKLVRQELDRTETLLILPYLGIIEESVFLNTHDKRVIQCTHDFINRACLRPIRPPEDELKIDVLGVKGYMAKMLTMVTQDTSEGYENWIVAVRQVLTFGSYLSVALMLSRTAIPDAARLQGAEAVKAIRDTLK